MATPSPTPPVPGTPPPAGGLGQAIELTLRLATSWWGLVTAYAGGVTLAIVAFQKLEVPLRGAPVSVRTIVVAAPLALALVFHAIPTLAEQRRKKRLREITGKVEPGYFSLAPREDEGSFRRADGKHTEVLAWLRGSLGALLYITGLSGSGKSSLLGAWVLPKLRQQNIVAVHLRGHQDPLAELERELQKPGIIWQNITSVPGEKMRALLERARRYLKRRRLLIVLDQFEEFLILGDQEQRDGLRQFFSSLTYAPIDGITFVLVFRSDYIGRFQDLRLPPLLQDGNWKEVPPFSESTARFFIEDSGIKVEERLLLDVLREAAEIEQAKGLIRPITINLCGLALGRFSGSLPRGFRPPGLIRSFLQDSLMGPEVRDVAPRLIPYFITSSLTKRPRTLTDLAEETGLNSDEVRGCLLLLGESNRAIVRPLDTGQETWEISHDFVVPLLDSIVARATASLWRKFRPLLPWISAVVMVLAVVLLSNLKQDPVTVLKDLGWAVTRTDIGFRLEAAGIPPKGSIEALRRIHKPIVVHLDIIDPSIAQWRVLENLTSLDLNGAPVSDIRPLKELKNLTSLNLSHTEVSDIGPLRELKGLTSLDLSNTSVSDVGPLEELKNLTSLDLSSTQVSDLAPLRKLGNLTTLSLLFTRVSDVGPLANLKSLTRLNLLGTKMSAVRPLKDLKELTHLNLAYTAVRNVGALKDLRKLTSLNLSHTQARVMGPLKELRELTSFEVHDTNVGDVGLLRELKRLTSLDLSNTRVSNVRALKELRNLVHLNLSGTRVSDLAPLRDLENLTTIAVSFTAVNDASPLAKLKKLTSLDLSNTRVSNVRPLKELRNLVHLNLSGTKVSDLSPLRGLENLTTLYVFGAKVSDASRKEIQSAIPNLDIR